MPTRRFDGVDDEIRCAIGSCDRNAGGTTFGILCKKNVNAVWQALIGLHNTLGTAVQAIEISNANSLYWDLDVTGQSVDGQVTVADGWVTVLFGKDAGATATARASKLIMSSGVWTHSNAGGTMTDGVMPGASGTVRFGEWEDGDDFNGWLGCAAVWASNLSDVAREAIAPSLQAWKNSNPVGLWAFNQDSVATAVVDLMGNGANQSAITGTNVDVAEVPPNFSFSLGITQAIGVATEADSSAALISAKTRALAGAAEADIPGALSGSKTAAVAAAGETDAAASLAAIRSSTVGQVSETDAAGALASAKVAAIGVAAESGTAGSLVAAKSVPIVQAAETNTVAVLSAAKVISLGIAAETDSADTLSAPGAGLGQASEQDTAQSFGAAKIRALETVSESEQAQSLLVLRQLGIVEALEGEQAQAFGALRSLALVAAQEGSSAQAFGAAKVRALAGASEQDAAQGFFFGSVAGKAEVSHVLAALMSPGITRPMAATVMHKGVS